ncbi:MAG: PilZ domain-containing protein [Treponema sp.]|nr:PilZ domain-containing protein [Treponema sp.]
MNFDFQAGGSPLASRQNPVIYVTIVIGLVIIAVFFAFWFIQKKVKQWRSTPEWIKKESERATTKKDVMEFADKNSLSPELADLLWRICKKYVIRNINYSIKEFADIDGFFKRYYDEIKNLPNMEKEINGTFFLKFQMGKIFAASEKVSSTRYLTKDSRISEIFPDGSKIAFKVYENRKEDILIEITDSFFNSEDKPKDMDKVAFTFSSSSGMPYAFVSRLIRYETLPNGKHVMHVSHSNDLIVKQQRNFKRINLTEKCKISSVKSEVSKRGKVTLLASENRYDCTLLNVSGGGCCISTNLPVKEGQLINTMISTPLGAVEIYGKIIKTRKAKTQGLFNLHVQFTDISIEEQNKIFCKVYNFM